MSPERFLCSLTPTNSQVPPPGSWRLISDWNRLSGGKSPPESFHGGWFLSNLVVWVRSYGTTQRLCHLTIRAYSTNARCSAHIVRFEQHSSILFQSCAATMTTASPTCLFFPLAIHTSLSHPSILTPSISLILDSKSPLFILRVSGYPFGRHMSTCGV